VALWGERNKKRGKWCWKSEKKGEGVGGGWQIIEGMIAKYDCRTLHYRGRE
jgi:hypothetical protein